jgi:iron complex outermembrane receptor protein
MRRASISILAICVVGAPTAARADEVIVVHGDRPREGIDDLTGDDQADRDRRMALAEPPFVTRIHVDEHAGEQATLADVVGASAGTHVRSLGGLGGFSSISVRGAASGHTTVLVDGVPLSRVATVTADLGRFELDSFSEVELYRGGVPVALGGAALGGALALETRLGARDDTARDDLWASAGVGSFGARHLRARWGRGDPLEGTAATVELGYAGAAGDFTFFDDGGTNLNPDDDGWSVRGNNGYDHGDAVVRVGGAAWVAGARALVRRQGLPGSATAPAMRARLDTASVLGDGGWAGETAELRGWALVERTRFADRAGEIGLGGEDRRYLTAAAGATAAQRWTFTRHALALAVDGRADWFRDDDLLDGGARTEGARVAGGVAISDDLALLDGRWIVEPALRLDVLRTDPLVDRYLPGMPEAPARTDLAPSPRLSSRALLGADVAIKGSAGWYFRSPTLTELYGDRGFIVGSPDLRAERGPTCDLGVVVSPAEAAGPVDRILVETVGFASWPRDAIALVTSGGLVARPLNVGDARLAGVEASASARLARTLTLSGNYTFLATEQRSDTPSYHGKPLPQRPRHAAYARADVARTVRGRTGVVWLDLAWIAGNFLDQAARNELPARRLVGAGVKLEVGGGVTVGLEAKNLLDARVERVALDPAPSPELSSVPRAVADFGGYPLPGRALYLAVEWRLP